MFVCYGVVFMERSEDEVEVRNSILFEGGGGWVVPCNFFMGSRLTYNNNLKHSRMFRRMNVDTFSEPL